MHVAICDLVHVAICELIHVAVCDLVHVAISNCSFIGITQILENISKCCKMLRQVKHNLHWVTYNNNNNMAKKIIKIRKINSKTILHDLALKG